MKDAAVLLCTFSQTGIKRMLYMRGKKKGGFSVFFFFPLALPRVGAGIEKTTFYSRVLFLFLVVLILIVLFFFFTSCSSVPLLLFVKPFFFSSPFSLLSTRLFCSYLCVALPFLQRINAQTHSHTDAQANTG